MKKLRLVLVALIALLLAGALTGCLSVQVAGDLVLKSDGTGTRSIIGKINKDTVDENGITYYYLKKHGDDLKKWVEDVYTAEVPGSEEWLSVSVVDSGKWETVTITFKFSSLDEYKTRLKALAYNEEFITDYLDPEISMVDGVITGYKEDISVMTAIMKSIHASFIADDTIYDNTCTDEYGNSLTKGPTDKAETDGMALMDPEYAPGFTIKVDKYRTYPLYSAKEGFGKNARTSFAFTIDENTELEPEPVNTLSTEMIILIVGIAAAVVVVVVVVVIVVAVKKKKKKVE